MRLAQIKKLRPRPTNSIPPNIHPPSKQHLSLFFLQERMFVIIILYQGPISRAELDYIRGVNSQFILRNLLVRGLIEKIDNPKDQRSFLYKPTLQLLSFIGISKIEDIPDFQSVKSDIENFKQNTINEQKAQN